MNGISEYLFRVICAAFVCALVGAVGGDGPGKSLRKLMAGLFLALTVLSPLQDAPLPRINLDRIRADARAAVQSGEEQARQAQTAIITEGLQAYIWNKAGELGLELAVRVVLDDMGMPQSVVLTGHASPSARQSLETIIARDLGLGKESLIWNSPPKNSE